MKITAIWDRHIPAPERSMVFCLLNNGEFLELRPEIEYEGENAEGQRLLRRFLFPAYKIWNIAAHFRDIVDGELTKENKARGYNIAASTGLEDFVGQAKESQ